MQPGDLVKLRAVYGASHRGVSVGWDAHSCAPTTFPEGTGAVFLGCHGSDECWPCILIEGRVGWVWAEELEAL